MNRDVSIRMELDFSAMKVMNHIVAHNEEVEKQVKAGIDLAVKDLCEGDLLVEMVRERAKLEMTKMVSESLFSYEFKNRMESLIQIKMTTEIEKLGNQLAEELFSKIKF